MAATNNPVGIVTAVKGEVYAVNADGVKRALSVGDEVFAGEKIISANGSSAEITPNDGPALQIAEQQTVQLDGEVTSAAAADRSTGAVEPGTAETAATVVQQAAADADFNVQLEEEAAAAGLAGDGAGGGHSFVSLLRIAEDLQGVGYDFPTNPGGDAPTLAGNVIDGLPTAGDLAIALDEDDLRYVNFDEATATVAWLEAFRTAVGDAFADAKVGWGYEGNNDTADGDDIAPDSLPVMTGALNFDYGTSGVGDVKFNTPTAVVTSGGETVQYWMSAGGHTVVGYIVTGDGEGSEEGPSEGDNFEQFAFSKGPDVLVIFSAEITDVATGAFKFTLFGPVDHADGSTEDNFILPLSFTVTDGNGDAAVGTLTVNIDDDSPALVTYEPEGQGSGSDSEFIGESRRPSVTETVDEDDIARRYRFSTDEDVNAQGTSPNDGDADGSFTGNSWEDRAGPATVSGYLGHLVSMGADGGSFSLSLPDDGMPALTSQGSPVTYAINDAGTLVAMASDVVSNGEGEETVDRLVFTLSMDADGSYSFKLYDQLDHSDPQSESEDGSDQTIALNLAPFVLATDSDGDTLRLADGFTINITDDAPELSGFHVTKTVQENDIDTPWSQGTSTEDGVRDGSSTGSPDQENGGPAFVSGDLSSLVKFGADGEHSFGFTSTALQTLYSTEFWGPFPVPVKLQYSIVNDEENHTMTLVATEPDTVLGRDSSNPVFELELDTTNGSYEFRLHDELRHLGESSESITLNFGAIIEAQDGDGDAVSLGGSFAIKVVDDVPSPELSLTGSNVQHDETAGNQPQPADDTGSSLVSKLFTGIFGIGAVSNPGNDPDVAGSGAIGYARSGTPVVSTEGSEAGADHFASDALSLRVIDSDAGLQTTEGHDITLSLDSLGRIVGRVDDADAGAMNGKAAFAVALDQDGELFVAQYLSLKHPDAGNANDTVDLSGKVAVRYSMTDTDDDTVTTQIDVGAVIRFADDGPTLSGNSISQDVAEANVDTSWSDGSGAGEGPAVVSGNLAGLVNFGADGKGSFGFAENAVDQLVALGLASKQDSYVRPLAYTTSSSEGVLTITATETDIPFHLFKPESWGDTSNPVFKLSLDTSTGAYEFRLYDELVHANGDAGTEISLNFGSIIEAFDGDGDKVSLGSAFTINVQDDVPVLQGESRTADEDYAGELKGNVLTNDEAGADHLASFRWLNTHGNHGDFDGDSNGNYEYNLYNSAAQSLDVGESRTDTFTYEVTDGDGDVRTATLTITITGSNDAPRIDPSVDWLSVDEEGMPTGSNPSSNSEMDTDYFTVSDPDGLDDIKSITFDQTGGSEITVDVSGGLDALKDTTFMTANGEVKITDYYGNGKFGYKFTLTSPTTDNWGSETNSFRITVSDGDDNDKASVTVYVTDDKPDAVAKSGVTGATTLDETGGLDADDTIDASALFNTPVYGADGAGSTTYTLSATNGAKTGLYINGNGSEVKLYKISDTQYEGRAGSSSGTKAFTVSIDNDGQVTVTQNAALNHPVDGSTAEAHDDGVSLASAAAIKVVQKVTDADGDSDSATSKNALSITFKDDGPSLSAGEAPFVLDNGQFSNLILNGSFEDVTGHRVAGSGSGTFVGDSSIPNGDWTGRQAMEGWQLMSPTSQWMEPHDHSHAGVNASSGDNYMDLGDTTHSPAPDTYAAQTHIGQLVAGLMDSTDYQLSFAFRNKAEVQEEINSGNMQVLWNGSVVATTNGHSFTFNGETKAIPTAGGSVAFGSAMVTFSAKADGWQSATLTVNSGEEGASHRLEFKEIGDGNDNWGMAIDSVSMMASSITYTVTAGQAGLTADWGADGKAGYQLGALDGWTLSGDKLTLSKTGISVSIDGNSGTLTVTQTAAVGDLSIPVVALDGDGDSTSANVLLSGQTVPDALPDSISVKVLDADTVTEGGVLVHRVVLVDGQGHEVRVPDGEWVQVNLGYSPSPSNGASNSDYAAQTAVRIYGGTSGTYVFVNANEDSVYEGTESYQVSVAGVSTSDGASIASTLSVDSGSVTGTITDNDPPPSFSINDVTVSESAGTISFTVTKTGATALASTVHYDVAQGTALTPGDYAAGTSALSGDLTFAANETTKTITLNVANDSAYELQEEFYVNLSAAGNATISDAQGVGRINDNDTKPSFAINDVTVSEAAGTITFTVTKSGTTAVASTVDYAVAAGTAGTPGDYAAGTSSLTGTLSFAAGELTKTVTLNVANDTTYESQEQFFVNLSNAVNATISDNQGVGTINDNDALPLVAGADRLYVTTASDVYVPQWAFLANDSTTTGDTLSLNKITAKSGLSEPDVNDSDDLDDGMVNVKDDGPAGGEFSYELKAGSNSATGDVDVIRVSSSDSTIDGDATDDIIYDGSSGSHTLNGHDGRDVIFGNGGNDTLDGGADRDILYGGSGDDVLKFDLVDLSHSRDTVYDGGSGTDTLSFTGSGESLDLTDIVQAKISGIETIDLTGTGNNTLTLNVNDVLDIGDREFDPITSGLDERPALVINGNDGDKVNLTGGGWSQFATNYNGYDYFVHDGSPTGGVQEDAYVIVKHQIETSMG